MRAGPSYEAGVPVRENARMDGLDCPCGLGEGYGACCGRFHDGAAAPTAELLMRSRYSAFAVEDAAYLLRTWHSSTRPRKLELDPACRWARLAVLETHGGGLFDTAGTVSFRAVYVVDGRRGVLDETSRFVREAKRWVYLGPVDGQSALLPRTRTMTGVRPDSDT